ncbi:MAG: FadR family transcriptional regulator [Actinobacteria bacterium]|nr:MAG: FadR family transcriptional regulator [Actinomycetota bacterium]
MTNWSGRRQVTSNGVVGDATVTRAERAAQRIAERARGATPGARLGTKTELREWCGVSVGTFNEALRLLQSRGVVAVRPGPRGGLFVAEQSPMVRLGNSVLALDADAASVADAVRIRDALDPLVTMDALAHSSPAAISKYREQVTAMQDPMLRSIYTTLLDIVEGHTLAVRAVEEHPLAEVMQERCQLHADLVEAIAARDADEVARLAAAHSVKPGRDAEGEPA